MNGLLHHRIDSNTVTVVHYSTLIRWHTTENIKFMPQSDSQPGKRTCVEQLLQGLNTSPKWLFHDDKMVLFPLF